MNTDDPVAVGTLFMLWLLAASFLGFGLYIMAVACDIVKYLYAALKARARRLDGRLEGGREYGQWD